jgi:hypothetical protein
MGCHRVAVGLSGSLLILTGCTGAMPSSTASHAERAPGRSSSLQPTLIRSYSPCTPSDLTISFGPSGYGVGHSFGALHIRNLGQRACVMTTPIRLMPLNALGRPLRLAPRLISRPPTPPLRLAGTGHASLGDGPRAVASVGVWVEGHPGAHSRVAAQSDICSTRRSGVSSSAPMTWSKPWFCPITQAAYTSSRAKTAAST